MNAAIFRVIVPVADMESGVGFYRALFGVEGERVSIDRHYFPCGDVVLALVDPRFEKRSFAPNPDWLYLAVPSLEEALSRAAEAGAVVVEPIADHPWGERSFYINDPFGNPLCFVDAATLFRGGRFID